MYSCDALYYTSLGGYSTLKGKYSLYLLYKLYVLYLMCYISDYDIAAFLESMYKEKEQYDADNNICKTEGACTFFKYVSIYVYICLYLWLDNYIYLYVYKLTRKIHI